MKWEELRKQVEELLTLQLGRKPTKEEIDLETDVRWVDRAGGSVTKYGHGKHKKS